MIGNEPGDPPPAPEFVPVTADDLQFPEGFEVDNDLRDEALTLFNNRELSPKEQLQGLFDLQLKAVQKSSEAVDAAWDKTQKEWQDTVKADADIGGAKLSETLGRINKLVSEYGDDELGQAFLITGAGNNPAVIRFLNKIAVKLTEPGTHVQGLPKAGEATRAERLFPSMKGSG